MLVGIRHGLTDLNHGESCLRGWLPCTLTPEGMKASRKVGETLLPVRGQIDHILCCDLVRAVQSAEEIASCLEMEIIASPNLRTLDVGDLTGEKITPEIEAKIKGYVQKPDETIPG